MNYCRHLVLFLTIVASFASAADWVIGTSGIPGVKHPTSIASGNDRFVVGFANGTVAWSEDGIDWTQSLNSPGGNPHILFNLPYFYAVSNGGLARSEDGETWEPLAAPNLLQGIGTVVSDGEIIVATSSNLNVPSVQTITDNNTASLNSLPGADEHPYAYGETLTYGGGKFWNSYYVNNGFELEKRFASSPDGIEWTEAFGHFPPLEISTVAFGNGRLVVGSHDQLAIISNYKGEVEVFPKPAAARHNILYGGNRFFASSTLAWSLDAKEWHDIEFDDQRRSFHSVVYGNNRYVAVGSYSSSPSPETDIVAVWVTREAPGIHREPQDAVAVPGQSLWLEFGWSALAPTTFQWMRNGDNISGATKARLAIESFSAANVGLYTCLVTSGGMTTATKTVSVQLTDRSEASRLTNLSVRNQVGLGDETLITGFVLGGANTSQPASLLVRSVGPSLIDFGVTEALSDPGLEVYAGDSLTPTILDNWEGSEEIRAQSARLGAFPLAGDGSLDAAILLADEFPQAFSVHNKSMNGQGGVVLSEIYDATENFDRSHVRLINLSCRTVVRAGSSGVTIGFVLEGKSTQGVLIRAVGRGLEKYGVSNPVGSTSFFLYRHGDRGPKLAAIASSWLQYDQNVHEKVGAFPLGNGDSAMIQYLQPGVYTVWKNANRWADGVILLELYEIP